MMKPAIPALSPVWTRKRVERLRACGGVVGDGVALGVADATGVTEGVGVAVSVGVAVGVTPGVGVGLGN